MPISCCVDSGEWILWPTRADFLLQRCISELDTDVSSPSCACRSERVSERKFLDLLRICRSAWPLVTIKLDCSSVDASSSNKPLSQALWVLQMDFHPCAFHLANQCTNPIQKSCSPGAVAALCPPRFNNVPRSVPLHSHFLQHRSASDLQKKKYLISLVCHSHGNYRIYLWERCLFGEVESPAVPTITTLSNKSSHPVIWNNSCSLHRHRLPNALGLLKNGLARLRDFQHLSTSFNIVELALLSGFSTMFHDFLWFSGLLFHMCWKISLVDWQTALVTTILASFEPCGMDPVHCSIFSIASAQHIPLKYVKSIEINWISWTYSSFKRLWPQFDTTTTAGEGGPW